MSLLYYAINSDFGSTCIWEMIEDNSFYAERMNIESSEIPNYKGQRLQEWLATRYLAALVDNIPVHDIRKDEYDKPHFVKNTIHLSISHSKKFAAYASFHQPIGIDLQVNDPRFVKIHTKYTTEEECGLLPDDLTDKQRYLYIWTIKEAAFKLHGRKNLPYKSSILIEKSEWEDNHLFTRGMIKTDQEMSSFKCRSVQVSDFVCTSSVYEK